MRSSFNIRDHQGKMLNTSQWIPENNPPKSVIQIVHGMAEHIERYSHFANFLARNGHAVVAHDHRGHGKTDPHQRGFVAEHGGFELMVRNIQDVLETVKSKFPGLPHIFFGHSMGSFLVQRYLQVYDNNPSAVIYSGSNGKPPFLLNVGIFLSAILMKLYGPESKSPILDKLSFGEYNKKFRPNRTKADWLSRDNEQADLHMDDPLCGFICSTSFYHQLFTGLKTLHSHQPFADHSSAIPVLLLAGTNDPVSGMGKGIKNLRKLLVQSGIETVDLQVYEGGRHEMINEINRKEVYHNLLNWINTYSKTTTSVS